MFLGIGLSLKAQLLSGVNPFASLMSTLLSGATQLIAHPLEYGSMFQDRAGTTPVTEPGQLVGMVLDHGFTGSKPVPTGPELVTNGGFDAADGWSAIRVGISDGVADFSENSDGASQISRSDVSTVSAATYAVSFDASTNSTGSFLVILGGTAYTVDVVSGANTYRLIAGATATDFRIRANFANSYLGTIDNISVRELPGYHATAISDAARGVLREVDGIRYIEYNGVNTAYSTPALPAPLVDKAQVFAGMRKLSDAAAGAVVEISGDPPANNGTFSFQAPNTASDRYGFFSRGTIGVIPFVGGYSAPITNVLTGLGDISGDLATLRIDGTQVVQNTGDQGTGNYNPSGTYPLYYGARSGTLRFFNGRSYATLGPIVRFSAANATAAQIEAAEAYYTARVI